MDYERKTIRWYWLVIFIFWVGCSIILLFTEGNPYLYSTRQLKTELVGTKDDRPEPIPSLNKQPALTAALENEIAPHRFDTTRTAIDPSGVTRDRAWVENWSKTLTETELADDSETHIDDSGLYLAQADGLIQAFTLDGQAKWTLQLALNKSTRLFSPVSDKGLIYFASQSGRLFAVNKATGHLQWFLDIGKEILSAPFLWNDSIHVVFQPTWNVRPKSEDLNKKSKLDEVNKRFIARINRKNGVFEKLSEPFECRTEVNVSYSEKSNTLVLVATDRVLAFDLDNLMLKWTQILPDELIGYAAINDDTILISSKTGNLTALSNSKKGANLWQVELDSPAIGSPTLVPLFDRVTVQTKDGYLHMIDHRKGESLWKFNLMNENPLKEAWSSRLNGRMIELTQMKWHLKGWTLWSPCGANKVCIYNPEKGQIIERIQLSGRPLQLPYFDGRSLYMTSKDHKKMLRISHLMEKDDYEKLKKEEKAAQEAAKEPSS